MQFRFSDEEFDQIHAELTRALFIQGGLRTPEGISPLGAVREKTAKAPAVQMKVFIENLLTKNGVERNA